MTAFDSQKLTASKITMRAVNFRLERLLSTKGDVRNSAENLQFRYRNQSFRPKQKQLQICPGSELLEFGRPKL